MRIHDPGRVLRAGVADRVHDALARREPVEHEARAPRDRPRPHPMGDRLRAVALEPPAVRHRPAGARAGPPARAFFAPSSCPNGSAASVEATRQRFHGSEPAWRVPGRNSWSDKAMFLNALDCDEAAKSIIKSRAEPSRAEPSRAEPSRAEPSRAEPSRAEPSRAEPSRASDIVQVLAGRLAPFPPRPAGRSRTLSRQLRTAARLRRCEAKPPVRAAGDTVAAR